MIRGKRGAAATGGVWGTPKASIAHSKLSRRSISSRFRATRRKTALVEILDARPFRAHTYRLRASHAHARISRSRKLALALKIEYRSGSQKKNTFKEKEYIHTYTHVCI